MTHGPLSPPPSKCFTLTDIGNGGHVRLEGSWVGGGEIIISIEKDGVELAAILVRAKDILTELVRLVCNFGGRDEG